MLTRREFLQGIASVGGAYFANWLNMSDWPWFERYEVEFEEIVFDATDFDSCWRIVEMGARECDLVMTIHLDTDEVWKTIKLRDSEGNLWGTKDGKKWRANGRAIFLP